MGAIQRVTIKQHELAYEDIIKKKLLYLRLAAVLLILGVAAVGVAMVTFLMS